jgi:hypothetical protein
MIKPSPRHELGWIDPITGSMKSQTQWFGFTTSTLIEQSAVEKWIIHHEGHYTNNWSFLHDTAMTPSGRPTGHSCGRLTEIYFLHAGSANDHFVLNASDEEIGTFVQVMRTGTSLEKEKAALAAAEKALK